MKIKNILNLYPEIFIITSLIFCTVFFGMGLGCKPKSSVPVIMKFEVGEVVQFKLDGRPAFIIKRTDYDMEYKVRFGEDYTTSWVKEIEVEALSSTKESIFIEAKLELTKKDSIISELTTKLVEADEFKSNVKVLIGEVETNEN